MCRSEWFSKIAGHHRKSGGNNVCWWLFCVYGNYKTCHTGTVWVYVLLIIRSQNICDPRGITYQFDEY